MIAAETNEAPVSQCWDDLNSIYANCVSMLGENTLLLQTVGAVGPSGDTERDLIRQMLVQRFANDIQRMSRKLSAINTKHANRTGGETNPDNFMVSFSIGGEYSEWVEMFNQTILADVADIQAVCDTTKPLPQVTMPRTPGKSVTPRGMTEYTVHLDESPFAVPDAGKQTVDMLSAIMKDSSKKRK